MHTYSNTFPNTHTHVDKHTYGYTHTHANKHNPLTTHTHTRTQTLFPNIPTTLFPNIPTHTLAKTPFLSTNHGLFSAAPLLARCVLG